MRWRFWLGALIGTAIWVAACRLDSTGAATSLDENADGGATDTSAGGTGGVSVGGSGGGIGGTPSGGTGGVSGSAGVDAGAGTGGGPGGTAGAGGAGGLTLDRPWLGELHLVAIYCRALSASEVDVNFRVGPST